jgi:hypothetical protein
MNKCPPCPPRGRRASGQTVWTVNPTWADVTVKDQRGKVISRRAVIHRAPLRGPSKPMAQRSVAEKDRAMFAVMLQFLTRQIEFRAVEFGDYRGPDRGMLIHVNGLGSYPQKLELGPNAAKDPKTGKLRKSGWRITRSHNRRATRWMHGSHGWGEYAVDREQAVRNHATVGWASHAKLAKLILNGVPDGSNFTYQLTKLGKSRSREW